MTRRSSRQGQASQPDRSMPRQVSDNSIEVSPMMAPSKDKRIPQHCRNSNNQHLGLSADSSARSTNSSYQHLDSNSSLNSSSRSSNSTSAQEQLDQLLAKLMEQQTQLFEQDEDVSAPSALKQGEDDVAEDDTLDHGEFLNDQRSQSPCLLSDFICNRDDGGEDEEIIIPDLPFGPPPDDWSFDR